MNEAIQVDQPPSDCADDGVAPLPFPTVTAWLRVLWTGILFPGVSAKSERWRWTSLVMLLAVTSTLLFPCLSFYLFEPDEGRYAQIPREMLTRGDWIVPWLQSEPYLDKPPLFYWLVMVSFAVFGFHDWAALLVPALAVQVCVLLSYLLGRRIVGERSAFWGALVLALVPGFLGVGRLLVLDGILTLWTTLSIYCAFIAVQGDRLRWGWWLAAALACGLGVLTKGPIAIILPLPPLLIHRWLLRGNRVAGAETFRSPGGLPGRGFEDSAPAAPRPATPGFSTSAPTACAIGFKGWL